MGLDVGRVALQDLLGSKDGVTVVATRERVFSQTHPWQLLGGVG
jgi:hypothetical protein